MSQSQKRRLDRIPDPRDAKPKVKPWLMKIDGNTHLANDSEHKHPMTSREVEVHHAKYGQCIVWEFVESPHKNEAEHELPINGVSK